SFSFARRFRVCRVSSVRLARACVVGAVVLFVLLRCRGVAVVFFLRRVRWRFLSVPSFLCVALRGLAVDAVFLCVALRGLAVAVFFFVALFGFAFVVFVSVVFGMWGVYGFFCVCLWGFGVVSVVCFICSWLFVGDSVGLFF